MDGSDATTVCVRIMGQLATVQYMCTDAFIYTVMLYPL